MAKVLILFAHPALEKSRVHKRMVKGLQNTDGIRFHDLYEAYPDLDIDVKREQKLLSENDVVVLQHPFYWYSSPAIVKQWLDLVLEHGWAYGPGGTALAGKKIFNAMSSGGPRSVYAQGGRNRFTIRQFLAPFEQTALLCQMQYLPPYVVHGTHRLQPAEIDQYAAQYRSLLLAFRDDKISDDEWKSAEYLNDLITASQTA